MSNPAYLWLTDENGSPMRGPSLVSGREGAIKLKSFTHNVNIPVNGNTGRLTGTRVHMPIMFQKEFDRVTPLLFRALSTGKTLRSAIIKMYQINEAGIEQEYFNIILEGVKLTSIPARRQGRTLKGSVTLRENHLEALRREYSFHRLME